MAEKNPRELMRMGIEAVRREDYDSAGPLLKEALELMGNKPAPEALSYYGLCLAATGKTKQGLEFCQAALKEEFYNSAHYLVLAKIYDIGNSRRKAIDAIAQGLKIDPDNHELANFRHEMGVRKLPPIKFLSRNHPVNQVLGRVRHALKKPARPKGRRGGNK